MSLPIKVVSHHFGGGTYLKIWRIEAGGQVPQHRHKFPHLTSIMSGTVCVEVEGEEPRTITAPDAFLVQADKVHVFTALGDEPAVVGCIHATDVVDPDKIDEELISLGEVS